MSIHIEAKEGQIADKILLPGDPLRAKYIAETFLENPVCYNQVRNILGYTGTYKGKRVSVQGTGMGVPSIGIYAYELMNEYKVKRAIRVGTCGSMQESVKLRDVIIATTAHTDSSINANRFPGISYAPSASFSLVRAALEEADKSGMQVHCGPIYTSDCFYSDKGKENTDLLARYGTLGVEMETAELYTLAARFGVEALTLLTVSDSLVTGELTSAEERQTTFNEMMKLALEII